MRLSAIAFAALAGAGMLVYSTPVSAQQTELSNALKKLEGAISSLEAADRSLRDFKLESSSAIRGLQDDVEILKSRVRTLEDRMRELRMAPPLPAFGGSSFYRGEIDIIGPRPAREDEMESLRSRLRTLEDKVRDLRWQTPPTFGGSSSSFYRGETDAIAVTPRPTRVRLSNEFPSQMSVVLNGESYRLFPGESRVITVPPGTMTYQVLNVQQFPVQRTLVAGEEKSIRIFPVQP